MIKCTLITIGKLKEDYLKSAEKEYLKRLSAFAKINIIEVEEEKQTDASKEDILKKEATKVLPYLKQADVIVTLDEHGKEMSSVDFSSWISDSSAQGQHIVCVIGGPLGIDESLTNKAHLNLSLSKFTFPHQIVRILLLEQLYRAITISIGKKYHH